MSIQHSQLEELKTIKNDKENITKYEQIKRQLVSKGIKILNNQELYTRLFFFWCLFIVMIIIESITFVMFETLPILFLLTTILSIILYCMTIVSLKIKNEKYMWKNILPIIAIVGGEIISLITFCICTKPEEFTQITGGGMGPMEVEEKHWWE